MATEEVASVSTPTATALAFSPGTDSTGVINSLSRPTTAGVVSTRAVAAAGPADSSRLRSALPSSLSLSTAVTGRSNCNITSKAHKEAGASVAITTSLWASFSTASAVTLKLFRYATQCCS